MTTAVCLFPREKYPFTIEFLHPLTRQVVHLITVDTPDGLSSIHIPALAKKFGHAVDVRVTFADGEVRES